MRRAPLHLHATGLLLVAACTRAQQPEGPPPGCDPGLSGPDCTVLTALPTPLDGGLSDPEASFWDGSAIQADDGSWHLFASRFVNGCGLSSWTTNSECVHATAVGPLGPFQVDSVVTPAFCHNPVIRRAKDGTYLLFSLGQPADPSTLLTACQDGVTLDAPTTGALDLDVCSIQVQSAASVTGPWQAPVQLTTAGTIPLCPTNPSPVLSDDGSVALFFRAYQLGGADSSVVERLFTTGAPSWQGPYAFGALSPVLERPGEDPFVWKSADGSLRMLFNDKFTSTPEVGGLAIAAADGGTWAFSGDVYGLEIPMQDGTTLQVARRERPSIAWTSDGRGAVLYTGVVPSSASDRSYVMATPLTGM
jgi:hypothetical protein